MIMLRGGYQNSFGQFLYQKYLIKSQIIYQTFEDLGYKVMKIDRVYFAGLTKKNLPRKECRFLTKEEITILRRI